MDKLLPFDFGINHKPGNKMGSVDCLSRHRTEKGVSVSHYDDQFFLAVINKCRHDLQFPPLLTANAHSLLSTTSQSDADAAHSTKHAPRNNFSHHSSQGRILCEIKWTDCSPPLRSKLIDALFSQLPDFDFHPHHLSYTCVLQLLLPHNGPPFPPFRRPCHSPPPTR